MLGMRGIVLLAGGSGGSYGSGVIENLWADTIATAVPRTQKSPAYAGRGRPCNPRFKKAKRTRVIL
jgi:hypothetical protein